MKKIKREMQKTEIIATTHHNTQVAFNSDGCLMVRKYDHLDKDKDEIILFTCSETREIIELFKRFASLWEKEEDLQF